MEEQVLKRVEFSAENESGSEELERYVLELESQIRNMKAELDELRPLSRMAVVDSLTGLS